MKVYGSNEYKAYLYSSKTNSKYYIDAVDPVPFDKKHVTVYFAGPQGQLNMKYEVGSNKKIDLACKTWIKERRKNRMPVRSGVDDYKF